MEQAIEEEKSCLSAILTDPESEAEVNNYSWQQMLNKSSVETQQKLKFEKLLQTKTWDDHVEEEKMAEIDKNKWTVIPDKRLLSMPETSVLNFAITPMWLLIAILSPRQSWWSRNSNPWS